MIPNSYQFITDNQKEKKTMDKNGYIFYFYNHIELSLYNKIKINNIIKT